MKLRPRHKAFLLVALLGVAILAVNNLRDIDGDREAAKKTLAMRYGAGFAKLEYLACVLVAALGVPAALVWYTGGHRWALAGAAALVLGVPLLRIVFTYRDPRALNRVLAGTGLMLLIFSVAFSVGWIV